MATIPVVNDIDKRNGLIIAIVASALLIVLLILIKFEFPDPPPVDIPLKTEMPPLDEIVIKELTVEGGTGAGKPVDAPLDKPKDQTEEVITKKTNPDTKVKTGKSNHTNANNQTNTASSPKPSDDPFASGGDNNGTQGGSGGKFGNDNGSGTGTGSGIGGTGKGRIRLNDPNVDNITSSNDVLIHLKLTIDEDGNVISAVHTPQTTTSDGVMINKVKDAVKRQVKYNKDPGSPPVQVFLSVNIDAQ